MKSLQFNAFIRLVLSYLRVELFEAFALHLPLASKGCEYYIWFLDANSWFTLCRVSSVPFGRADKNLLYVCNMLNKNQEQMFLHTTLHSL